MQKSSVERLPYEIKIDEKYQIVTSADNNFARQLGVMLYSLLYSTEEAGKLKITVLTNGIERKNIDTIKQLLKPFLVEIEFLSVNNTNFNSKFLSLWPVSTLYRLNLERFFQEKIKKLLYIDCDMLVLDDVAKLFCEDIGINYIGAVQHDFGIDYFNAGLMIVNLEAWRENSLSQKMLDYYNTNAASIKFHDQDVLNMFCKNRWYHLDKRWNAASFNFIHAGKNILKYLYLLKPRIFHFSGPEKRVWEAGARHPYKWLYASYALKAGWVDFPALSFGDRVRSKFPLWASMLIKLFRLKIVFIAEKYIMGPSREFRGKFGLRASQIDKKLNG